MIQLSRFSPRSETGSVAPTLATATLIVLLAVAGGMVLRNHSRYFAQLLGGKPHFVKLTWKASPSPRVAGYNVYRSTTPGGQMVKLNMGVIAGLEYTDTDVEAGHTYYYGVTTVNDQKLESSRTADISVTVPNP